MAAAASPERTTLPNPGLNRPASPHEIVGSSDPNASFSWPPVNAEINDERATTSTSLVNNILPDATTDPSNTTAQSNEKSPKGQRQSSQGHARSVEGLDEANRFPSSSGSSSEPHSRNSRIDLSNPADDNRIEGKVSKGKQDISKKDDSEGDSGGRKDPSRSSNSSKDPTARASSSTAAETRGTPEKRNRAAEPQSPVKPQTSHEPRMCLVTFPTHELITLVASLLQRIAAANDKLRRDRVKGSTDAPKVPSPGPSTVPDTGRQRSSYARPDPAAMVIPPFRSKSSTTTPQASPKQSAAPRDDAMRESPPPTKELESGTTPATSSTSTTRRGTSIRGQGSTGDHHTEVTLLDARPPSRWPTTTAAEHAVSHPSSLLCFHARNVPSIGVETYLQRILKYCPVTNDVFISLLVYFDRMSRKLANHAPEVGRSEANDADSPNVEPKGFAIDSYNVHRLVIAGITISSKFHSDVFYTNSRYAKVGGLPQTELNQLELQFLLLNDFNLMIPLDEMQQYADRLLVYGREGSGELPRDT